MVAFTARRLGPRVNTFQALHPDIDLQVQASDDVLDLDTADVDIAICYGAGPYPNFKVSPLFADRYAAPRIWEPTRFTCDLDRRSGRQPGPGSPGPDVTSSGSAWRRSRKSPPERSPA